MLGRAGAGGRGGGWRAGAGGDSSPLSCQMILSAHIECRSYCVPLLMLGKPLWTRLAAFDSMDAGIVLLFLLRLLMLPPLPLLLLLLLLLPLQLLLLPCYCCCCFCSCCSCHICWCLFCWCLWSATDAASCLCLYLRWCLCFHHSCCRHWRCL